MHTKTIGGLNIFQAAAQCSIPGGNVVAGNHWVNTEYSIAKLTMERFATMFGKYVGANVTAIRAINACGPGQSVAAP